MCRDWSSQGSRMGFAGKSARSYLVFIHERMVRREPFFIQECVESEALFDLCKVYLGELYDIQDIVLSPTDLGHPHRRSRQWVTGVLRAFAVRTRSMKDMLPALSKQVVATGDIYYVLPPDVVANHTSGWTSRRTPLPVSGFRRLLSVSKLGHLEGYEQNRQDMIEEGKLREDSTWISDLLQSPFSRGDGSSVVLSTLLQRTERWSHLKQRCLLGDETLAAQGVPTPVVMQELARTCARAQLYWQCPFASAFGQPWMTDMAKKASRRRRHALGLRRCGADLVVRERGSSTACERHRLSGPLCCVRGRGGAGGSQAGEARPDRVGYCRSHPPVTFLRAVFDLGNPGTFVALHRFAHGSDLAGRPQGSVKFDDNNMNTRRRAHAP